MAVKDFVTHAGPPEILRVKSEKEWIKLKEKAEKAGYRIVELNGGRMRDKSTIVDEFDSCMELPSYFGGNWDALEEVLTDPGVIGKVKGCLLIIHGADLVAESSPEDYEELLDILLEVSRHWGGQRPAMAFKTALISEGPPPKQRGEE